MITRDRNIDPTSLVVRQFGTFTLAPAQSLTNAVLWLFKAPYAMKLLGLALHCRTYTATLGARLYKVGADQIIIGPTLAIDATPEKFKLITKTVVALFDGVVTTKAPATAIAFSAAYTINTAAAAGTGHWGAFLVQLASNGTVSTKAVSADQDYATEALAIAALPLPDSGKLQLGYITVQVKTGGNDWIATTDDLTPTSDCTTALFYSTADLTTTMTASVAPVAGTSVEATLQDTEIAEDEYFVLLGTTDGSFAATDLRLTHQHRAIGYRGGN